jgi:hypothetical protein
MKTLTSSSSGGKCRYLSLRLTTKAMAYKNVGQEEAQEAHLIFLGVQENVKK